MVRVHGGTKAEGKVREQVPNNQSKGTELEQRRWLDMGKKI